MYGSDTSAASFEKTLSSLSTKISKSSTKNDSLRKSERQLKVWWTLWTGFAYILAALILTLVTGVRNWGAVEISVLAGSPLIIYGVRVALTAYYNYRITGTQDHLNSLYKQRDETIKKLKAATKYDSTQQLLDKYGGSSPSEKKQSPSSKSKGQSSEPQGAKGTPRREGRTSFVPPPTANIPRAEAAPIQGTPPRPLPFNPSTPQASPHPNQPGPPSPSASFAPNAFSSPPQNYALSGASYAAPRGAWYDRLIDVLLGEDETQPRNRIALVCQNCRLVNGQAPPGTKSLSDVGTWRCTACGTMNGETSEVEGLVGKLKEGEKNLGASGEEAAEGGDDGAPFSAPADIPEGWGSKVESRRSKGNIEEEPVDEDKDLEDDDNSNDVEQNGNGGEEESNENEPPAKATRSRKKKNQR
ncbi:MAG: hypothetical protein M1820_010010 [Bogoriella megaspora]|nr:MAG: hypothetical protein M1820_010010 [Bogoriella megaspora]